MAHLNFVTHDLDRVTDFYVNQLGLTVKFTLKNKAGQVFGIYFDCGNTTFIEVFDQALAVKEWGGEVGELTPGTRYKHFCFEVTGLEAFCDRLRSRGVEVTPITTGMDHARQAWIADPDGNAIELMEYGPDSLQLTGQPA
jgi:catechol 2,3-dioxygenase-like lactoylglutathione lyase family enzyme